jgi:hypothetical protein
VTNKNCLRATPTEDVHAAMSLSLISLLTLAFLIFVVGPIAMLWTFIDGMKRKASDRPSGGGGISSFVGAGLLEVDRLLARPSVEHQIETESATREKESDDGE